MHTAAKKIILLNSLASSLTIKYYLSAYRQLNTLRDFTVVRLMELTSPHKKQIPSQFCSNVISVDEQSIACSGFERTWSKTAPVMEKYVTVFIITFAYIIPNANVRKSQPVPPEDASFTSELSTTNHIQERTTWECQATNIKVVSEANGVLQRPCWL